MTGISRMAFTLPAQGVPSDETHSSPSSTRYIGVRGLSSTRRGGVQAAIGEHLTGLPGTPHTRCISTKTGEVLAGEYCSSLHSMVGRCGRRTSERHHTRGLARRPTAIKRVQREAPISTSSGTPSRSSSCTCASLQSCTLPCSAHALRVSSLYVISTPS